MRIYQQNKRRHSFSESAETASIIEHISNTLANYIKSNSHTLNITTLPFGKLDRLDKILPITMFGELDEYLSKLKLYRYFYSSTSNNHAPLYQVDHKFIQIPIKVAQGRFEYPDDLASNIVHEITHALDHAYYSTKNANADSKLHLSKLIKNPSPVQDKSTGDREEYRLQTEVNARTQQAMIDAKSAYQLIRKVGPRKNKVSNQYMRQLVLMAMYKHHLIHIFSTTRGEFPIANRDGGNKVNFDDTLLPFDNAEFKRTFNRIHAYAKS